jgi:hypothetical protein
MFKIKNRISSTSFFSNSYFSKKNFNHIFILIVNNMNNNITALTVGIDLGGGQILTFFGKKIEKAL